MRKQPRSRVAALIEKDGKYLLIKEHIETRGGQFWLTPGGGIEYGETMEIALKREVKEETGIDISVGKLFSVKDWIVPSKNHSVCIYFLAKATGGKLKKEDRIFDTGFFSIREIKNMNITPFTKELFEKLERESK